MHVFEHLLGDGAMCSIVDYTTQVLIEKGKPATNISKIRQFIATRILRSRFRLSTARAFDPMEQIAIQNGFILMDLHRYNSIMSSLQAYEVLGRSGADEEQQQSWFQQDRLLPKLHPMEESLFQNSMILLLNQKKGSLVIDVELVAS